MRCFGRLTGGLALVSLLPAAAAAQDERPFTNAWFWGVKGGAMTVKTPLESEIAPTAGVEFLVTRTRAGLLLSFDQGYFSDLRTAVPDAELTGGARGVSLKNFRRGGFTLVAFPEAAWGPVKPYAGVGMSINLVQRALPTGTFDSEEHKAAVLATVEDRRSRTSATLMAGVQGQLRNARLFVQATAMPTGSRFLLSGAENTYQVEAGVRFNMGNAIERIDRR